MARNVTLAKTLNVLKVELGEALAENADIDEELYQRLESMQELLEGEWDWPFLHDQWDAAVAAEAQYVNFPTVNINSASSSINFERPLKVQTFYDNRWRDLEYGITTEQYNQYLPTEFVGGPVRRWAYHGSDQFEVWPVPTDAQTIRFTGVRHLSSLRDEHDDWVAAATLDLDHLMIAYFCAAERLARLESADARLELNKARQRMLTVRGQYPSAVQQVTLGRHAFDLCERLRIITVGGNGGTTGGDDSGGDVEPSDGGYQLTEDGGKQLTEDGGKVKIE